ncbi:MAG: AsmA-like C-terminal region-containing protein [Verrucomicrobiota bacterium]|nr:AsmA-like C-terminal region-containing protein [Verrucomicrobiota bacterium]
MKTDKPTTASIRARLFKLLALFFLLVLALVVYLGAFGCPEWLSDELVRAIKLEGFAIEADAVKLHPIHGVVVKNVRLYRKQVIGPPALEAGQVTIALDPLAPLKEKAPLMRRVVIRDGVFRADLMRAPEMKTPATAAPPAPLPGTRFYLELENARFGGLAVERSRCEIALEERTVRVNDIAATLAGGGKKGEVRGGTVTYHLDQALLDGAMETRLDPRVLLPLLEEFRMPKTAALAGDYEFGHEPPRCEVKFSNYIHPDLPLTVETRFWFQDGKYKGVDLLRADGVVLVNISKTNFTVAVRPLFVVRKEGTASACLTVDANRSTVEFEGVSTLDPRAMTRMIGILTNGVLDDFRFDGQVNVAGHGVANYEDLAKTRLNLRITGRDLGWNRLKVEEYGFDLNVDGLTNALNDIRGRFYGGDLSGRAVFVLSPDPLGDASFEVAGRVSHAGFERFMKDVEKNDRQAREYAGRLSVSLNMNGLLGETNTGTINGKGAIRVKEGKVLLLPIFGELTKTLTDYIPGLDFVVNQTDVKSEFKIAEKKISTENICIEGNVIRLNGYGDYHFDNTLDFRAQVRLLRHQSILSYLTDPIMWVFGKLFEFRLEGDVSDPRWTAFSSTMDLLKKIGLKKKDDGKDQDKKRNPSPETRPTSSKTSEETEPRPPDEK